jgi:hypothetical protein
MAGHDDDEDTVLEAMDFLVDGAVRT